MDNYEKLSSLIFRFLGVFIAFSVFSDFCCWELQCFPRLRQESEVIYTFSGACILFLLCLVYH
jgi:hypothetical protein